MQDAVYQSWPADTTLRSTSLSRLRLPALSNRRFHSTEDTAVESSDNERGREDEAEYLEMHTMGT